MPELPEVEAARALAQRVAAGRRIVAVRAVADPLVFEGVPPARVRRALLGRRVLAARRHGKHLWLELDARPWPVVHFGMAGGLRVRGAPAPRLVSSRSRPSGKAWPPRFTRLALGLDDGTALAFTDARRLGRIRLRHDPAAEPPVSLLGFDALRELPPPARFEALLRSRAAPVKAVLLDQGFAAGVGNWIADEVLYQARVDPRRPARSLARAEALAVRAALARVLATAVRAGADGERFPRGWLFHRKWDHDALTTVRGQAIRRETVAGRTTAWVPAVQR